MMAVMVGSCGVQPPWLRVVAVTALLVCGIGASIQSTKADDRPNILFLMADQMRADALGIYGNEHALTPNLDRIAKEGVFARHGIASTPTCTPARAAILTGQSPWNNGMLGYGAIAERYPVEMPRLLHDAGYFTASKGKDHFGWDSELDRGIPHGYNTTELYDGLGQYDASPPNYWMGEFDDYDQWFQQQLPGKDPQATLDGFDGDGWNGWRGRPYVYDEYYHPTAWLGRLAVDFLSNYSRPEPFFLKVSFHRPHSPYDPPQRVINQVQSRGLPPLYVGDTWDDIYADDLENCGPQLADAWCGKMPDDERNNSRVCYAASVTFVDEQIGYIMHTLEKRGMLNNTYIFFTADHGDGQSDHRHWRKGFPYFFSARVPFLFRWPDGVNFTAPRGSVIEDHVVELRDILHTAVDIANASHLVPSGHFTRYDGSSVICLLKDPSGRTCDYAVNPTPWREWLDMEHSTVYNATVHWNALMDTEMKYIFHAFDATEQLFNISADPHELHDLSGDPAYQLELALWRGRMVAQFEREGRGSNWVVNSTLLQRTHGQVYSPNFPPGPTALPKTRVVTDSRSRPNDRWLFNETLGTFTLLKGPEGPNMTDLCLTYNNTLNGVMYVDKCRANDVSQMFSVDNRTIIHLASGLCVTALSTSAFQGPAPIVNAYCVPGSTQQQFLIGASGRTCANWFDSLCITVDARYPDTTSRWWSLPQQPKRKQRKQQQQQQQWGERRQEEEGQQRKQRQWGHVASSP